jgi:hypothetical protein
MGKLNKNGANYFSLSPGILSFLREKFYLFSSTLLTTDLDLSSRSLFGGWNFAAGWMHLTFLQVRYCVLEEE